MPDPVDPPEPAPEPQPPPPSEAALARSPSPAPPAPEVPPALLDLEGLAPLFFALGDRTRLRLVAVLSPGTALSITSLTSSTALTRQAVTKHLRVLAEAGLVSDVKSGRERLWQFNPWRLDEARRALDAVGRRWAQ